MADDANDRWLESWREVYRERQTVGSGDCPEAAELVALVVGELSGEARERLADHVVTCRLCSSRHRDLSGLDRVARPDRTRESLRQPRPWWGRVSGWSVGAAAAVLLIGVTLTVTLRLPSTTPIATAERGSGTVDARVTPADRAVLKAPPGSLSWSPADGATDYRVVLYDFESTPVWEGPAVEGTSLTLPDEVVPLLETERPYYWRVFYVVGVERRQSRLYTFTIAP